VACHFHRVVAVVVNHGELAAAVGRQVAVTLEAPAHALELGQRPLHRGVGHVELHATAMADSALSTLCSPAQVQHHRPGQASVTPLRRCTVKCICRPRRAH
jgi:hypothetical protein